MIEVGDACPGNSQTIYIHIGYGRTGTSWLQKNLFPSLCGITYHGKFHDEYPAWLRYWNYMDPLLLPKYVDFIRRNIFSGQLSRHLISSEAFTQTAGIVSQAERIKSVILSPKIILVLREPSSLVISKFRHLKARGIFKGDIEEYLDFMVNPYDWVRREPLYLLDYNFPLVIRHLRNQFGDDKVLILKFETLLTAPDKFINLICNYLEIKTPAGVDLSVINESNSSIFVDNSTKNLLFNYFNKLFSYDSIAEG